MPDVVSQPTRRGRAWPALLAAAVAAVAGTALLAPSPAEAYWVRSTWVAPYPYYYRPRPVIVPPPVVIGLPPPAYAAPVYAAPVYVTPRPVWAPGHWRYGYWVPGHWR